MSKFNDLFFPGGHKLGIERSRTTILLIRHGECEGNREGLFRGRSDFPLNDSGKLQARALAEAVSTLSPARVFSGPLSRATETAQAVCDRCSIPLEIRQGFNNMALGKWEKRKKSDVEQEYPEEWRLWLSHPERLHISGAETLSDVQRRSFANLNALVNYHEGETFVVVSHRAVLKPLLAAALGIGEPYFWRTHIDTASFSILTHEKERGYCLVSLNQTSHLEHLISEWV
ncbi:MAG: histidine phosphatase family protein [Thermovirgaceae bacterium]|nr:histidine phosphatase family protein [Thermovirgaceae bacterium]